MWIPCRIVFFLLISFFVGFAADYANADAKADWQLFQSIEALDVDGVKRALISGADPNAIHPQFKIRCPLSMLMFRAYLENDLGASRAELESDRAKGREIAELIFSQGAKIRYRDDLLFFPILEGDLQMIQLLIEHGASALLPLDGRPAIEWAIYYDQNDVIKFLEENGARPREKAEIVQIKLYRAVHGRNVDDVIVALEQGADIDGRHAGARTPLTELLSAPIFGKDRLGILRYLLDKGADANKAGGPGKWEDIEGIPIHLAVVWARKINESDVRPTSKYALQTITMLIENGALVSHMDSLGRTPLHIACVFNSVTAAEILLDAGCRVMPKDNEGKTPLDYAESSEMISLLKKHGAVEKP